MNESLPSAHAASGSGPAEDSTGGAGATPADASGARTRATSLPLPAETTAAAPAAAAGSGALADVPEDIREAARLAPDHWLGIVDPAWQGEGPPPAWALAGEYRSGTDGEIVEWRDNDDYRPSPATLGWPDPTDQVDEAVQFASTGYGSEDDVMALLAGAEVAVLVAPDGRPLSARTPDGDPVVPVFTSDAHLESAGQLESDIVPVTALVPQLPEGHRIFINPTGAVCMVIETDALKSAIEAAATEDSGAPTLRGADTGTGPEAGADRGPDPATGPGAAPLPQ
jgi:SseB protein N-terminal domain